ncbi:cbb3-type cytochrome c oxidase subunit I [uncultured Aquimonas sp.]|uniref:cbb3-type cytochrome c oxidase subunit I n=1 Tax=uncultured Aquimonas sp. TaxID=385483 RepID=UPI0026317DE6|nr:cbb3-type cytochrome c oxidase subunit I [uncultured Aquimonas sp.]
MIFAPEEIGRFNDPADGSARLAPSSPDQQEELRDREAADRTTAMPVFVLFTFAVVWLLVGSAAGLLSSIKLHAPDLLVEQAWLTFGRLRTIHLNAVAYGWVPLGLLGLVVWLLPRLLRTPLRYPRLIITGAYIWNAGLVAGIVGLANGLNTGMEWLEIPWYIGSLFAVGGMMIGLPMAFMLRRRTVHHLYVSVWYIGAALFWFPILYIVANIPGLHFGVEQATMNWWYGHNVLGLFYTPLSIACVYYFLPKVIGRPVQSYNLSLLGFWTLAFFYGQVGAHHLIGGPIPEWLVTLSIVQSMMMLIPVLAFSVNQHLTLKGHFALLKRSHTLRFIVFGAMMYTVASVQGSAHALRSLNALTHFTHFTVAHAHIGMYGFVSMVLFGGMYFAVPRVLDVTWPKPALISLHFWLVVAGFAAYIVLLSTGGVLQGLALLDGATPFIESVRVTKPWLLGRSIGGGLMTLGHIVFAVHFYLALKAAERQRQADVAATSHVQPDPAPLSAAN